MGRYRIKDVLRSILRRRTLTVTFFHVFLQDDSYESKVKECQRQAKSDSMPWKPA